MRKRTLNLDMDGVIVNLNKLVKDRTGTTWDEQPSSSAMWRIIREKVPNLFEEAEPLPDARYLVDGVLKFAKERELTVEMLTAVPRLATFPLAVPQKQAWLRKHFPELATLKFKTGPHSKDKWNHATPGDILIDDNHMNIAQWAEVGGIAILHINAETSLSILKGTV